jgi:dihydroxyacid dehydratase/phosphogluconate dehydratase
MTTQQNTMQLAILNTSIITAFGSFKYSLLSLEDAQNVAQTANMGFGILSAVGHQSTAEILTELLGFDVPVNRIQFAQEPGQDALVFKLKGRAPEGKILSREEIETVGYEFGLLTRTA